MHLTMTIESDGVHDYERVLDEVERCAASLAHCGERPESCRVLIARPHREGRHGALYSVRVDLVVAGEEMVVNRDHRFDLAHEDVLQAVKRAFEAARRKLANLARHHLSGGGHRGLAMSSEAMANARIEHWIR